ncbi:unnamed protein product [Dovyalis caffra]|uniref:Uncharacterized protein n=1 Tax=Dovyalis caffra TaxID=77055 RepID=A0AAV1QV84_9ROSI|nr:unnamed protein product [Dovyalis caffra]
MDSYGFSTAEQCYSGGELIGLSKQQRGILVEQLRWAVINLGLVRRESQCLDTDWKRIKDLTGSLERMSVIMSWGKFLKTTIVFCSFVFSMSFARMNFQRNLWEEEGRDGGLKGENLCSMP